MELLFAFGMVNIVPGFPKTKFIDLALLYSCGIEKLYADANHFWQIDSELLYMVHFNNKWTVVLENRFGATIVIPN